MTFTPPAFSPALTWQDNAAPALDAANLNLEESAEATYAAQVGQAVVSYLDLLFVRLDNYSSLVVSGDWGPALTQAMADAQSQGKDVLAAPKTYGFATGSVAPRASAFGYLPSIVGSYNRTVFQKLADVTILDYGGASVSNFQNAGSLLGIRFDGNNHSNAHPTWTAPLCVFNWMEEFVTWNCIWGYNAGQAWTSRGTFDTKHFHAQHWYVGRTDGSAPATSVSSSAGDGNNATSCLTFHESRWENISTGACWVVGADAADAPFEISFTGVTKVEQSQGNPFWGPLFKFSFVNQVTMDNARFTMDTTGAIASGQTTPFIAFIDMDHVKVANLGRIRGDIGDDSGTNALSHITALIRFNGSNVDIGWESIKMIAGDGTASTNAPGAVVAYVGTNEGMDEGPITWNTSYLGVPNFSGSATNYAARNGGTFTSTPGAVTTVSIPHAIGDANGSGNAPLTPRRFSVQPANANARGAPSFYLTVSTTNIALNFSASLTAATSYSWVWRAEA